MPGWGELMMELRVNSRKVKDDVEAGLKGAKGEAAGKRVGDEFSGSFADRFRRGWPAIHQRFVTDAAASGKAAGDETGRNFGQSLLALSGGVARNFWHGYSTASAPLMRDEAGRFAAATGKMGTDSGDKAGRSFMASFAARLKSDESLISQHLGGYDPRIAGAGRLGGKGLAIGGGLVAGLGALPAAVAGAGALGVGGLGAGAIALGARELIGSKNVKGKAATEGPLYDQAQAVQKSFQATMGQAVKPLLDPLKAAMGQIPGILKGLTPQLQAVFAGAGTLIKPLLAGLTDVAHAALPGIAAALKAVAPLLKPLLDGFGALIKGLLPGLVALLKAAMPAVTALAQILGGLGKGLGDMFTAFAPAVKASAVILKALGDVINALFPVIGQIAGILAKGLAPVFVQLAGAVRALMPFLVLAGKVLGDLASVMLGVVTAALTAIVKLLQAIAPALTQFAGMLAQIFTVLENKNVFQMIATAIENVVPVIATLINTLIGGLIPILPPLIDFMTKLAAMVAGALGNALKFVMPLLSQLATTVLGAIAKILPVILPPLLSLVGALGGGLGKVLALLLPPLAHMAEILVGTLAKILPQLIPPIEQMAKSLTGALLAALIKLVPPLAQIATVLLQQLAAILPAVIPLIAVLAGLFTQALAAVITAVADALAWLISQFTPKQLSVIIMVVGALMSLKTVVGLLKDGWGLLMTAMKAGPALLGLVTNPVFLIIAAIALLAFGIFELVKHWSQVWGFIKAIAKDAWDFLTHGWGQFLLPGLTLIRLAVEFVRTHWRDAWQNMKDIAHNFYTWLWTDFGQKIADFFTKTIPHWFDLCVGFAKSLWTRISAAFVAGWNAVWAHTITPMANFFLKTIPHWWDLEVAGVKLLWTKIGNAFVAGWNWVWSHTLGPMETLFTKTLPGWFDSAVKAVKTAWDKIQDTVRKPIRWVINNVIDKLIGIINKVLSFVHLGQIGTITMAAGGARITKGTHETADDVLALVSRNETIVSAKHSRILAPAFAAVGVPGYAGGGVPVSGPMPTDLGTGIGPGLAAMTGWFGPLGDPTHQAGVNFAGHQIFINKFVAGTVAQIGNAIASAYPGYVDASTGGWRTQVGASTSHIPYSMHQLGLAIDVNPDTNPYLGNTGSIVSHPKIIDIFRQHGWFWGGNWGPGGRDQMHFQLEYPSGQQGGFGKIPGILGGVVRTLADIFGGLGDAAKVAIDLAHGDEGGAGRAMASLLGKVGLAGAAGPFGDMLTHIPPALIKDAMHFMVSGVKSFASSQQGSGPGAVPALSGSAAAAQAFARAHLAQFGWGAGQWPPLRDLWQGESGWNANAVNPSSGAAGIPQALGHGHVFNLGDYANQVLWGMNYIKGSYGSPATAYSRWLSRSPHWYAGGGWINEPVTGVGRYSNALYQFGEAGREYVTPEAQMAAGPGSGAPLIGTYTTAYYGTGDTADAMRELTFTLRRARQGAFFPAGS